jgi:hypothetical protein
MATLTKITDRFEITLSEFIEQIDNYGWNTDACELEDLFEELGNITILITKRDNTEEFEGYENYLYKATGHYGRLDHFVFIPEASE